MINVFAKHEYIFAAYWDSRCFSLVFVLTNCVCLQILGDQLGNFLRINLMVISFKLM